MQYRKMASFVIVILGIAVTGLSVRAARAAGNIGADESLNQIQAILSQIPTGQQALAMGEQHQVQVSFASGKGTFYLASRNTIVIDSQHQPMRAALSFVHEVNHARFWHEGLRADISSLSVEEYARLRVLEEAEGVARSIEAKMELQAAGVDVGNLYYPLEPAYREASREARTAAIARERGLPETELVQIGRAAGLAAVIQSFMDGRVLTSHTLEPYTDFYGHCWEKADVAGQLLGSLSRVVSEVVDFDLLAAAVHAVSESC
jgi:hypothetical protein